MSMISNFSYLEIGLAGSLPRQMNLRDVHQMSLIQVNVDVEVPRTRGSVCRFCDYVEGTAHIVLLTGEHIEARIYVIQILVARSHAQLDLEESNDNHVIHFSTLVFLFGFFVYFRIQLTREAG